ncbi:hypothetical protein FACS189434_14260 [Bacteroidia bacterium]|nr:hypothetical protein FACS189434_14260 [Bacteroidia bacterium]
MKTIKYILVTLLCVLGTSAFAEEKYVTVYSCGFEDNEDLSNWELNPVYYFPEDNPTMIDRGEMYKFHIGNAEPYMGNKSLYLTEDGGNTNIISISAGMPLFHVNYVTFDVNLTSGKYIINMNYKLKAEGAEIGIAFADNRNTWTADEGYNIKFPATFDWDFKTATFTIPDGVTMRNCIIASVYIANDFVGEGVTIDNIVIRRLGNLPGLPAQVRTSDLSALLDWQAVEESTGYLLNIYKDREHTQLALTIEFDADGHVLSTQQHAKSRMATASIGFQYPIEDLLPATTYYYTLTAFNEMNPIAEQQGEFTTKAETTGINEQQAEKEILKEEYFGIDGASVSERSRTATTLSHRGVIIKRTIYTDGTVKVEKVLR